MTQDNINMNNSAFSPSDKKSNFQIPEIPLNSRTGPGILSSNSRKSLLSSLLTHDDEFDLQSTPANRLPQKSIKCLPSPVTTKLLLRTAEGSRPQTAPSEPENGFDCLEKVSLCRYDSANRADAFELNEPIAEKKFISHPRGNSIEKCNTQSSLTLRDFKQRSLSCEPQKSSCLTSNLTLDGDGPAAKVRQMQNELDSMRNLLKMAKDCHKEEIKLLEQSYASRMKLLEENSQRREQQTMGTCQANLGNYTYVRLGPMDLESSLKRELEFSSTHYNTRINQLEELLETNRTEFTSTVGTVKDDTFKIVANLQREHSMELEALVEQHAKTIENLRKAEAIEAGALNEMQPTAEALKSLFAELISAIKELNHAEAEHSTAFSQRSAKLDLREEVLRMGEERLCDREKEIEKMQLMLTGAISKLEVQMKEQNKTLEEDRWALKQEQVRLSKLQIGMEEDRRALIEHAGKERNELQKLIANFLEEHREAQARLASEHKSALEEQQELKADRSKWKNKKEEEMNKLNRLKEELESAKEAFLIERHALDERTHQLHLNEIKLTETQHHLDFVRGDLQNRELTLCKRSDELDRRYEELTNRAAALNGTQAAVTEIDAKCQRLAEEQRKVDKELEERRSVLDERERQLEKKEERLAQRWKEFEEKEKTDKKIVCSHCKRAVKRSTRSGLNSVHKDQPENHVTILTISVSYVSDLRF
ncbi:unnamed protein product [Rodentolepis nana]|uniref:Mitotic spindle assembly checkpoint protein MAD1 n=1 Tax=Rodentolepis nana TaxID=102285 RepID=A0A0R3TW66_RODNA|nr:unnamed protein product [Rodentolepis nana]